MSWTTYRTRLAYDAMLPASPRLCSPTILTTPARALDAPPGNDGKLGDARLRCNKSRQRDVIFFSYHLQSHRALLANPSVPPPLLQDHCMSLQNFTQLPAAPYQLYDNPTARSFAALTPVLSSPVRSGHVVNTDSCSFATERIAPTSPHALRIHPVHHGEICALQAPMHGHATRQQAIQLWRPVSGSASSTSPSPKWLLLSNDVDKRCVNCESFTNAANAPIPDSASQSAPAPAAPLRPAPHHQLPFGQVLLCMGQHTLLHSFPIHPIRPTLSLCAAPLSQFAS